MASGQSHRPVRRLTEQAMGGAIRVDDGHVAATATHDDGLPYIHLVDVDTGEDRQALPRPRITLDRQPDGDTILVASDDRLRLFLWEPATGRERELPLPVEVSHRPIIDADLAVGARSVDVVVGPEVWTVPILGPGRTGPATRAYAPPAHKSFWGNELGADGQRYVLLGEERGDLYRITLPR